MNDNIGERITLAELPGVAGLSEMHVAAQFRLATGLRPHDHVMHRRIQHARQMMIETKEPIVQVALAVGFQTQPHFTAGAIRGDEALGPAPGDQGGVALFLRAVLRKEAQQHQPFLELISGDSTSLAEVGQ